MKSVQPTQAQNLNDIIGFASRSLTRSGPRLSKLEGAVEQIKLRQNFWKLAALIGLGLAVLFAWAWWDASRRKAQ